MTTRTQQYIQDAVAEAKKELAGNTISHCRIEQKIDIDIAAHKLASALDAQAQANEVTAQAMLRLAESLKPTGIFGIKIDQKRGMSVGGCDD